MYKEAFSKLFNIQFLPEFQDSRALSSVTIQAGLCQTWSETRSPVSSRRGSFLETVNKQCYSIVNY